MIARIAQWIRSWTLNQRVVSSIPTLGTLVAPLGKVLNPHCFSPPSCINGYPAGQSWNEIVKLLSSCTGLYAPWGVENALE